MRQPVTVEVIVVFAIVVEEQIGSAIELLFAADTDPRFRLDSFDLGFFSLLCRSSEWTREKEVVPDPHHFDCH